MNATDAGRAGDNSPLNPLAPQLATAVEQWKAAGRPAPDVVLVSGSGLSVDLEDAVVARGTLDELTPFVAGGIVGHPLSWELLSLEGGRHALYFRGRLHAYQGYTPNEVVFGLRLAALLGAKTLVISNASGGIGAGLEPGDLVLIDDHINLTGLNPLRGSLPESWGPQFPDLTDAYSHALRELSVEVGSSNEVELKRGVYAGLLGPSYETPAEIRYLRTIGADLVGMSTVLEVIAASHMGLRCLGISLVTNTAAGLVSEGGVPAELDHDDVLEVSRRAAERYQRLLTALLAQPELVAD